jgi:hypothetical protein
VRVRGSGRLFFSLSETIQTQKGSPVNSFRKILAAGAVFVVAGLSACSTQTVDPDRGSDGKITKAVDNADALKLQTGDCLNVDAGSGKLVSVPVVPCDEDHKSEVFASFDNKDAKKYPGSQKLEKEANSTCKSEFSSFIGIDYDDSKLEFWPVYPSSASWEDGDRETLCVVTKPGKETVGSYEGAEI